jgi:hypothetical protein
LLTHESKNIACTLESTAAKNCHVWYKFSCYIYLFMCRQLPITKVVVMTINSSILWNSYYFTFQYGWDF